MKNRAISLLLALCLLLSVAPVTAHAVTASGTCGKNLTWTLSDNGVLTISGTGPMEDYKFLQERPWCGHESSISTVIIENGVTTIGDWAFHYSDSLRSVEIPDSVTNIGRLAFYSCSSLNSINVDVNNPNYSSDNRGVLFDKQKTWIIQAPGAINDSYIIPDSVTTIGEWAFHYCDSLISVEIGDRVTAIGEGAFDSCFFLSSVEIGDSVTTIGDSAFANCFRLSSVEIPDGVITIGDSAFAACHGLSSVEIGDSVTTIGDSAFSYCDSLSSINVDVNNPNYSSDDHGVLFDKQKTRLMQAPSAISGSYIIPDSVTTIGDVAFHSCHGLSSVEIPDSVTAIGAEAFSFCFGLSSVEIPDSVTAIGAEAFASCHNLSSIDVDVNNPNYSSDDRGVLFDKQKMWLIQAPGAISGSYIIPDSVTTIGDGAFRGCESLKSVEIGDGVTTIGVEAFKDCQWLNVVGIGDSVTTIGFYAFFYCVRLSSIEFQGDAPTIDMDAFGVVTATANYPTNNPTWTADVMQDYGGDITWVPYNSSNPFTDVPLDAYYEEPVIWAVENGITDGTSDTTFSPDDQCLRNQVVTFLHRAAKNPEPTSTTSPFEDVKPGEYFYKPVLWAVEKGITDGVADDLFGSNNVCTRGQVVTFLWRAAGKPEPTSTANRFTDVKPGDYFYEPVLWALENGITDGVEENLFGSNDPCTRGQVVTFLHRASN